VEEEKSRQLAEQLQPAAAAPPSPAYVAPPPYVSPPPASAILPCAPAPPTPPFQPVSSVLPGTVPAPPRTVPAPPPPGTVPAPPSTVPAPPSTVPALPSTVPAPHTTVPAIGAALGAAPGFIAPADIAATALAVAASVPFYDFSGEHSPTCPSTVDLPPPSVPTWSGAPGLATVAAGDGPAGESATRWSARCEGVGGGGAGLLKLEGRGERLSLCTVCPIR
jgi:hypothetical protein